ncbi:MAG: hypothetical protein AAF957_07130 [Planctomycetota bacterium]
MTKHTTGVLLMLAVAGAVAASSGCADPERDAQQDAEPWRGSLGAGVERMRALAEDGAFDDAVAVADRMLVPDGFARGRRWLERVSRGTSEAAFAPMTGALDALGFDVLRDADRAEVEYARAVTLLASAAAAQDTGSLAASGNTAAPSGTTASANGGTEEAATDAAGRVERAAAAYERARSAGGPARLDAVYALGSLELAAAEAVFETIPEISGGPPPPPTSASTKDAAGKDDEDPIDVARRIYLRARERFVELLRLGDDEDARANTELIIRRLRELDDVEKQREEQQKQDQQDQSDSEEGDSEKNENDEESSENEDSESKDGEQSEQTPQEKDPEQDDSQEQDSESEQREESEEDAPQPDEANAEEAEPEERLMTEEERKRLLEQNRAYQENGERLRRALRMRRKVPAKRDW